ncbi:MAG: M1 family metallopeptidase [Acidobacteria bacterium]|nr:M1 family metallopeptidase [Acidobacteriota bacterium]
MKGHGPAAKSNLTGLGAAWAVIALIAGGMSLTSAHSQQRTNASAAAPAPPIVASGTATSRQRDAPLPGARSARNANYDIDVRLDHQTRTLTGSEIVRWRNIGHAPADSLRLHLYWNGWRNTASTWMRENALPGGGEGERPAEDFSYVDVSAVALATPDGAPGLDLMPGFTFVQPDDTNTDDRTLASVALPSAVAPGDEVSLRVTWKSRVPRTFARTGAIGQFYFIAHWFPKVAVFEDDRWSAHQFHANTEFFSDYGRYDVRMTVPQGWVVGATGTEQSRTDNVDGTTTHRYVQDDVHDFTWTTSPDYVERRQTFDHPALPAVQMRLLMQPEHAGQEDRHFAATAAALRYYGEWYGAYPYGHVTVIDPAYQSGAGGMEYPTLFTAGTRWLAPRQTNSPEAVTVHEAGHQFWYGIVGNNEFEHAWLDEGLNTFSEERVQSIEFQPNYRVERFFGGFIPWQFPDLALNRATDGNGLNGYRLTAETDDPSAPTFRYWPGSHAQITYSKTALWLHTLERYLGWDTLRRIMATFFERWKFRHPRPEDFFAVANEVSGQDLTWFFDQVYRSSNVFDYGVERFTSHAGPFRGFDDAAPEPAFKETTNDTVYRTIAVVRRYGEAVFPVEVITTFANGDQVTEQWDGRERWRAYTYDRGSRALRVEVDPQRTMLLDVNFTNNSATLEPQADEAAAKWSMKWMVWLQDLLLTWTFFV